MEVLMRAYSIRFRQEVIALYEQGKQTAEVAELMGCCKPWARGLKQQLRETGTIEPKKPVRRSQRIYGDADEAKVRELLSQRPDATLAEIIAHLGKKISPGNVSRALRRMDLPRKKSQRMPPNRIAPM
jgi:transposase